MARMVKCIKILFHLALFYAINYFLDIKQTRPVYKVERFISDIKHLLIWTKFTGIIQEGQEMFISQNCAHLNCYLTTNRSLLGDVRYFDAIIFNVEDLEKITWDLPSLRSDFQKYIFAANDSANNYPVCSSVYDRYFNWTWSYRFDSSIPYSHITVYNFGKEELGLHFKWPTDMEPIDMKLKSTLQTKSKAAAIFLDKCESTSKRELYVKNLQIELEKYNLTVDVYGKCGTFKCGRRNRNSCYYKIKSTYYFYLALEESIAPDFVTDLVINGYKNNAVPVVFGGADYTRFLPPRSYLDGLRLGEKMLAKAMYEIIYNKEWYYDFFRWRNHYVIRKGKGMDFCTLCTVLNNPAWLSAKSSLTRFRKWWNINYEEQCATKKYFLF